MSTETVIPVNESSAAVFNVLAAVDTLTDRRTADTRVHGDSRSGEVYIVTDKIVTALKVALLTGRPLLLGGPPGCGKSSLASYVARNLGVAYYEFITTDESRSADLTWRLDAVRRLGDAQAGRLSQQTGWASVAPYVEPGSLWWALNPHSAAYRGIDPASQDYTGLEPARPPQYLENYAPTRPGSVLLIDEIDKADAAFCNGLLVPLGSRQVFISALDLTVRAARGAPDWSPLTIITTNNERDLPEAFLRRCIVLRLASPDADRLVEIVGRHFPDLSVEMRSLVAQLAVQVTEQSEDERPVSTAEFIDLVKVITHLYQESDQIDEETLATIKQVTLYKHQLYGRRDRMWLA